MEKILIRGIVMTLLSLISLSSAWATHNRAGEITYEQIGELSIRVTITTYTKTSSISADRDTLELFWGDGTSNMVPRTDTIFLPDDIQVNKYVMDHDYPGRSTYTMYLQDPNRVANILNVDPPNSVEVPFFLSTTFTFLDPQFQGSNNSATLLQPPLDYACVGQIFTHNPNAYDADGDSLSYELVPPQMNVNESVPNYSYPNNILPGANNQIYLDPTTGDFTWNAPQLQGEYNIAIRINEYRDGTLINSIIRDMQILVRACDNRPPTIQSEQEICVVAGELIDLPILVDDADMGDRVRLTASGGPFVQDDSPAILQVLAEPLPVPYTARLRWQTSCNHLSPQYYQIVLKAVDDGLLDGTGLATLRTIRIKVVGPAPQNVSVNSDEGKLRIEWDNPYQCQETNNGYFRGFSVWRKEGSSFFPIDTCQEGLDGKGYTRLVSNTLQQDADRYYYEDTNVEKGKIYCYRILGEFARQSQFGFSFNKVPSLPSEENCAQISRDVPLITKVSVSETDENTGIIHLRWTKPLADDLDTILHTGPYTYEIWRAPFGNANFEMISTQTASHFASEIDTNYFDNNLNTRDIQYQYRVDFSTNGNMAYGSSEIASSIYTSATPTDGEIALNWSYSVPWANNEYEVFRMSPNEEFEPLAITTAPRYTDSAVENDITYCYYVKSTGTYGLDNIEDPLTNLSQIICAAPVDNRPPCVSTLQVQNICTESVNITDLANYLSWTTDFSNCDDMESVAAYRIYYASSANDNLELIETIEGNNREFNHMPNNGVTGCYAVSAIDSIGNESPLSETICVDNCPLYELPNVFTPNADGENDLLTPRINRFIASIDLNIYNEWGNKIFSTDNPEILWDGKSSKGSDIPEGSYYYTCKVIESRVTGNIEQARLLRGYIQILRD